MVNVEQWEQIRRMYHIDKKSIREIERETGHAWRTIKRMVESEEPQKYKQKKKRVARQLGPYRKTIEDLLEANEQLPRKQRYTAPVIHKIIKAEGYNGAESTLRHYMAQVRKQKKKPKVYLPLAFDPGLDAQVDWGEGWIELQGERVKAQLFVMRCNYSRRLFVMGFPSQKQESFFAGHVAAFAYFAGVPQRLTYDNLKVAVYKVLTGKNRQEQVSFIQFRGHYLFESHFCTPRAAHEKGGVENAIGYVQRQFLTPLPQVESYEELNDWLLERCRQDDERTVRGQLETIQQMWEREQPFLRPLPTYPYDCCRQIEVPLTPYSQVVIETNRYSVPVQQRRQTLSAKVYPFEVQIYALESAEPLAVHQRCYGQNQDVFDPCHYLPLLEKRPGAFHHAKPLRQWREQWPSIYEELLAKLQANQPDGRGVKMFIAILQLHLTYPAALVEEAITQAVAHNLPHLDGVKLCLNRLLDTEQPPPPLTADQRPYLVTASPQGVNAGQYEALLGGNA